MALRASTIPEEPAKRSPLSLLDLPGECLERCLDAVRPGNWNDAGILHPLLFVCRDFHEIARRLIMRRVRLYADNLLQLSGTILFEEERAKEIKDMFVWLDDSTSTNSSIDCRVAYGLMLWLLERTPNVQELHIDLQGHWARPGAPGEELHFTSDLSQRFNKLQHVQEVSIGCQSVDCMSMLCAFEGSAGTLRHFSDSRKICDEAPVPTTATNAVFSELHTFEASRWPAEGPQMALLGKIAPNLGSLHLGSVQLRFLDHALFPTQQLESINIGEPVETDTEDHRGWARFLGGCTSLKYLKLGYLSWGMRCADNVLLALPTTLVSFGLFEPKINLMLLAQRIKEDLHCLRSIEVIEPVPLDEILMSQHCFARAFLELAQAICSERCISLNYEAGRSELHYERSVATEGGMIE